MFTVEFVTKMSLVPERPIFLCGPVSTASASSSDSGSDKMSSQKTRHIGLNMEWLETVVLTDT